MNNKIINNTIQDYSLRELQIYSSKILSECGATNSFIKQFKADNDSHQFYKNVIKWYVKKYQKFPEEELSSFIFKFPVNEPGLGDRFITVSTILYTMNSLDSLYSRFIVDIYFATVNDDNEKLNFADFYDVIDFFHFKRPSTPIFSNVIEDEFYVGEAGLGEGVRSWYSPDDPKNYGNIACFNYNMKNKIYAHYNYNLYRNGKYWPINYDKTIKKDIITFMFYSETSNKTTCAIRNKLRGGFRNASPPYVIQKYINKNDIIEFMKIVDMFPQVEIVCLESENFAKNVELLSRSILLIGSEGMWTHLSRAMDIDTIGYSKLPHFWYEFNEQGHFCSENFEECLTKLKEKCIDLKI